MNGAGGDSQGIGEPQIRELATRLLGTTVARLQRVSAGFSGAVVVDLESSQGRFSLRGWPPDNFSRGRLVELHRLLRHWHESNLPVAVPRCWGVTNESVVEHAGRFWQLEPWLPGRAVEPSQISDDQLFELMRTLARLHRSAFWFRCRPEFASLFGSGSGNPPGISQRRSRIAAWTPTRLLQIRGQLATAPEAFRQIGLLILGNFLKHCERIDRDLAAFEHLVVPLHPCWRDLWSEHVLFAGPRVSGLIDPGSARSDHVSSDLSRILGSLLLDDFGRWTRALEVYAGERPLSEEERRLIRVMDRSSILLSGMTWMERWEQGTVDVTRIDAIVSRLESFHKRIQNLETERSPEGLWGVS